MPVFIMLSIALSAVVQTGLSLPTALNSSLIITIGMALAVICIILNYFKKLPQSICYDLFASGTLVAWFVYWKPLFKEDSPIFFSFRSISRFLPALLHYFSADSASNSTINHCSKCKKSLIKAD